MAGTPSSSRSKASLSRSTTSRDEMQCRADEMLRASLTNSRSGSTPSLPLLQNIRGPSSASLSRSRAANGNLTSRADESLQSSLYTSRSMSESFSKPRAPSSASLSRAMLAQGDIASRADEALRSLLLKSRSTSEGSPTSTAPPSYHTNPSAESSKGLGRQTLPSRRASAAVDSVRLRKLQLQREVDHANARTPRRDTTKLFKESCSTDLLFLIDATGSMAPYLAAAKDQVRSIVADIKGTFFNDSEVRVAVVAYRDHYNTPHIETLDFTTSVDQVHTFLAGLSESGGADLPEDVLGGIQQALHMSWGQQTRCMVHIADAPPHGQGLHDLTAGSDDYYTPGSEPHGLTYKPLLRKLIQLKINYALLSITAYTDRMGLAFAQVYGSRNARLLPTNKHYKLLAETGSSIKDSLSSMTEPQFEELHLGVRYAELKHLVVRMVTSSVSRTAGLLTMAFSRTAKLGGDVTSKKLTAVYEDEDDVSGSRGSRSGSSDGRSDVTLEKGPPQWTIPGWLDDTLEVEGFCPAVLIHDATTLRDMMDADANIKLSSIELTIYARSKPFAEGAIRVASYARTAASTSRFVVKASKKGQGRAEVVEDMKMQALCKAFALEFNGLLKIEPPFDFVVSSCLQQTSQTSPSAKQVCLSLEPYIEGTYIKYNSNSGWVNDDIPDDPFNQMAQAFSHFTFERSWGLLLVNDLQGVGHLLTDPGIQTSDPDRFKLSDTNCNAAGFKFFFSTHKCNEYCRKLGLISNGGMFVSGEFDYREEWPTMEPTVCCSNKLCRSIIRLTSAHTSPQFPKHHWCDACWLQLEGSTARWVCIEPGPTHEFDMSRFYHESQGQLPPRHCPDHREKNAAESSAAAVGGSLWNRMKPTESTTSSISGRAW